MPDRREFLETLLGAVASAANTPRPNVLVFISDQQRSDCLGCYGNPVAKTPHLDRLAAGGARFEYAYCATPLCSPARASIFSGAYPHRHGIVDLWGKIPSIFGPVPGWPNPPRSELPWMGELFSGAGYHTAYCGKWHCLTGGARPGFQEILSRYGDDDDVETPEQDDFAAWARSKGYVFKGSSHGHTQYVSKGALLVGTSIFKAEDHPDSYLVWRATEFLRRRHDRPFLLATSVNSPHSPYAPPKPYDTIYDPRKIKLPPNVAVYTNQRRPIPLRGHPSGLRRAQQASREQLQEAWAHYLGMVTHIDDLIGHLVQALDEGGLLRNTVIVYTSDHGDAMGSHRVPDKGPYMYDPVTRVPLLISYPEAIRPQVVSTPVSLVSLLPTLLDLAGIRDPVPRDGPSWKPALTGRGTISSAPVFCEYNRFFGEHFPVRCIITDRYKYVHYFGPEGELFDLKEDPYEIINLLHAPDYFAILANLRRTLFRNMLESKDRFAALLTPEDRKLAKR